MLTFVLCEGVFLLVKITITVDDATLDCLRAMRELNGVSYSAAIRHAVLAYYQDKFATPPAKKKIGRLLVAVRQRLTIKK